MKQVQNVNFYYTNLIIMKFIKKIKRFMGASNTMEAARSIPDLKVEGNPDMWQLLAKASSESQQFSHSTKVMQTTKGTIMLVTSIQGGNISNALEFLPDVNISQLRAPNNKITS